MSLSGLRAIVMGISTSMRWRFLSLALVFGRKAGMVVKGKAHNRWLQNIGNMSYDTTEDRLRELFAPHGEVISVDLVTDRHTGQPRGFGFIEMATDGAAQAAIAALNGQEVDGRQLNVAEVRPPKPRGGDRDRRDRRRW